MQASPEMNKYNAILGVGYHDAVMHSDITAQLEFLNGAASYLSSISRDTKMYGDHHSGFEIAGDLLDRVIIRISNIEMALVRDSEMTSENEIAALYREHEIRSDFHKEMKQDAFGI